MREEYNIKELNPQKNPYAKKLKEQSTIQISPTVMNYFQKQAEELDVSSQTLINMCLLDIVNNNKKINWNSEIDSERRQKNEENSYCSRYAEGLY